MRSAVAEALELAVAPGVGRGAPLVVAAVHFHDEPLAGRDEVVDGAGERDLAPEGDSGELEDPLPG